MRKVILPSIVISLKRHLLEEKGKQNRKMETNREKEHLLALKGNYETLFDISNVKDFILHVLIPKTVTEYPTLFYKMNLTRAIIPGFQCFPLTVRDLCLVYTRLQ